MNEILHAKSSRFEVFENDHGFRLVRLSDKAEATFYGDDSCERFRDHFDDACIEPPESRHDEADSVGEWAERDGEFPGPRTELVVLGGYDPEGLGERVAGGVIREARLSIGDAAIFVDLDGDKGGRVWIEWRAEGWVVLCHAGDGDPCARVTIPFDGNAAKVETEGL